MALNLESLCNIYGKGSSYLVKGQLVNTTLYSGTGLESRVLLVPPLACLNESVNQILGVRLLMSALNLE